MGRLVCSATPRDDGDNVMSAAGSDVTLGGLCDTGADGAVVDVNIGANDDDGDTGGDEDGGANGEVVDTDVVDDVVVVDDDGTNGADSAEALPSSPPAPSSTTRASLSRKFDRISERRSSTSVATTSAAPRA
jgi:hypothetical protein